MKYTRKMKLVEIDDHNLLSPHTNNAMYLGDDSYSKRRVLSTLDNMQHNSPVCISVNLGQLMSKDEHAILGTRYKFPMNYSIVYDMNDQPSTFKTEVKEDVCAHSLTKTMYTSLQIFPTVFTAPDGGRQIARCAFSTVHKDYDELMRKPTMDTIETKNFTLNFDPKEPDYL